MKTFFSVLLFFAFTVTAFGQTTYDPQNGRYIDSTPQVYAPLPHLPPPVPIQQPPFQIQRPPQGFVVRPFNGGFNAYGPGLQHQIRCNTINGMLTCF